MPPSLPRPLPLPQPVIVKQDPPDVVEGETFALVARVVGITGTTLVQGNVASCELELFNEDSDSPDVPIYTATIGAAAFATSLSTDARWTIDDVGFAFDQILNAETLGLVASNRYVFAYTIVDTDGYTYRLAFTVRVKSALDA